MNGLNNQTSLKIDSYIDFDGRFYGGKFEDKIPDLDLIAKLPNPGLLSFLKKNELGDDIDYRTPLFDKANRDDILNGWLNILENANIDEDILNYDLSQKKNYGRYSKMDSFEERYKSIEDYFMNEKYVADLNRQEINILNDAINQSFDKRLMNSIRPSSYSSIIGEIPLNTNSGLPFFVKRRKLVDYYRPIFDTMSTCSLDEFISYINNTTCVLGWRGQPVDKQRVVWMFPMLLNIIEAAYYKPRISQIQKLNLKPEYVSLDLVDERVTKLFDTKHVNDFVIASDFDRFDQHFNGILQDISHLYKNLLLNTSVDNNLVKYNDQIHYRKFNIPILCTENNIFSGHHGMSSGSSGTNMDANDAHSVMQFAAACFNDSKLNEYSTVLGDDGIISYPGMSIDNLSDVYEKVFGQSINKDKLFVSKHSTKYLQRFYTTNFRSNSNIMKGVYPTIRALGRLTGHERFVNPDVWNKETITLRYWSILENCNNHPLFEKFVDYILSGDKFRLGLSIPGFLDKFGNYKTKDLYNNNSIDVSYGKYLTSQSDKSSIKDWSIYKYLTRLK